MNNIYNQNNPWTNQNLGMNTAGPGYTGFNNFQRPNMSSMIPGRLVSNTDEIMPQEVPMDGSVSLFPQQDYSCIYAKTWTKEGTIATVKYVPEQPQNAEQQKSPLEERLDRIDQKIDNLSKSINQRRSYQKRTNPHMKKKEEAEHE